MLKPIGSVRFSGVLDDKNVSGVSFWKGFAFVVTDEATKKRGNIVQVFQRTKHGYSAVDGGIIGLDKKITKNKPPEMDLEGVAVDSDDVYVLGSHSWKRKKVDGKNRYAVNRDALMSKPRPESSRDVLLKFSMRSSTKAGPIRRSSLRGFFDREPFRSFSSLAGKENGIDAEGLAFFDGHLYVGFRGPVLRGNFALVLKFRFKSPITEHELMFVNLGGRGIRDLAHTKDGLLILAGPVGDGPGTYQLYHWSGKDMVPGRDRVGDVSEDLKLLGDLELPSANRSGTRLAKAEGLALEKETPRGWDVLVVFDGALDGQAVRYRIPRAIK